MMPDLFVMGPSLTEKVARPLIVYLFLVIAFRFASKRTLAQLNPFDLVLLLILSNAVQNAIIGRDDSISGGIVAAVVLLAANGLMVRLLYRYPRLEAFVEGTERRLIEGGRILDDALRGEHITRHEPCTGNVNCHAPLAMPRSGRSTCPSALGLGV